MIPAWHVVRRRAGGLAAFCLIVAAINRATTALAVTHLEEVMSILEAGGISVTNETVQTATVNALLRAIDRRARIEPACTNPAPRAAGPMAGPLETWSNGIAYLPVAEFTPGTGAAVTGMLARATADGAAGIILDLRETGGDDMDSVAAIAGLYVAPTNRPLFAVIEPGGERRDYRALAKMFQPNRPTVGLIGAHTGGAAELLAGMIRESPQVILMGTNTAGYGRLLSAYALADGRHLMIPSRRLVLNGDRGFDGTGVHPDIVVRPESCEATNAPTKINTGGKPLTAETAADQQLLQRIGNDTTLKQAVDLLLGIRATHDTPRATSDAPAG